MRFEFVEVGEVREVWGGVKVSGCLGGWRVGGEALVLLARD